MDRARWTRLRETYDAWWNGTLERPVIPMTLAREDGGKVDWRAPATPEEILDPAFSPALLVDRWARLLAGRRYVGDAYPQMSLRAFGPVAVASFLGAKVEMHDGGFWYSPPEPLPMRDLHFEFDPANPWLQRMLAVVETGRERFGDGVVISSPEFGGVMDTLAVFRPGQELVYDMVDEPDEVARLATEVEALWHRYFQLFDAARGPAHAGYSDFSGLYSHTPSYCLYSDFSAMLSPCLFDRFVLPELRNSSSRLDHAFYHLDSAGQIPHLDSLLALDQLHGIQWVPGAGARPADEWPEVYRRVLAAGKRFQLLSGNSQGGSLAALRRVGEDVGSYRGIQVLGAGADSLAEAERLLAEFGVPL